MGQDQNQAQDASTVVGVTGQLGSATARALCASGIGFRGLVAPAAQRLSEQGVEWLVHR